jgi:6-phosphofructokinase 1
VTLKYIDPTYMVRTVPAIPSDKRMCTDLAWAAVNGAMAGFTGFTVGHVNNSTCMIPLKAIEGGKNKITPNFRGWQRLLAETGQPFFLNDRPSTFPVVSSVPVTPPSANDTKTLNAA